MRADNSHHIIAVARRRATATRKRAESTLRRMDKTGLPITFDAVAKHARVSRSWLYNQTDLRTEIERLRARRSPASPNQPIPDQQRATHASLLRRLESATDHIRHLQEENKQLREALALTLGERRTTDIRGSTPDTPKKKSTAINRPH